MFSYRCRLIWFWLFSELFFYIPAAAWPTRVFYGIGQRNEQRVVKWKRAMAWKAIGGNEPTFCGIVSFVLRLSAQWNSIIFRLFFMLLKALLPLAKKERMGMRIHFIEFVRTIQLWDGWRRGRKFFAFFPFILAVVLLKWPLSVLFPKKVLLLPRHNFCVAHLILPSNYRHQQNVHFSSHWIFITNGCR